MSGCSRIDAQRQIFSHMEAGLPITQAPAYESLVHFQEAYKTPIQRWYPYREGYSTELVDAFIKDLDIKGSVLDPFSGSGTTLLSARRNGLPSVGIEINPISVLVSEAENAVYTREDIDCLKDTIRQIDESVPSGDYFESSYVLSDKMFNADILQALLQFRSYLGNINNEKVRRLVFISWLASIDEVSDVKKEGNGLKYRYRKRTKTGYVSIPKKEWEEEHFPGDKFAIVRTILSKKLNICCEDITSGSEIVDFIPQIINGDCLDLESLTNDEFDLTFFSPPYCNCFDYFEIHKVELWLGGFVSSQKDVKALRETGFRSNTNALDAKPIRHTNDDLENLISLFDVKRLWSPKLPDVVRGYFDDTFSLLKALYNRTRKGGYVGIVIGNSAYSGVIVPSDILTAILGKEVGFNVENIYVARHLTTSSQQKEELEPLKNYLRESIVLLKK